MPILKHTVDKQGGRVRNQRILWLCNYDNNTPKWPDHSSLAVTGNKYMQNVLIIYVMNPNFAAKPQRQPQQVYRHFYSQPTPSAYSLRPVMTSENWSFPWILLVTNDQRDPPGMALGSCSDRAKDRLFHITFMRCGTVYHFRPALPLTGRGLTSELYAVPPNTPVLRHSIPIQSNPRLCCWHLAEKHFLLQPTVQS